MSPQLTEALIEKAKSVPGKAKEKGLNAIREGFDMVKGSDSIKGEIKKQIGNMGNIPLEASKSLLTAGNQLLHLHPIDTTKTIADGFIGTTKNIIKAGVAPLSVATTLAHSGINTGKKILASPKNVAFSAFHTAQTVNRKLFEEYPKKFKAWNQIKQDAEAPTETASPEMPATENPQEKKVPALMQIPGGKTETPKQAEPVEPVEPVEQSTPAQAKNPESDAEKMAYLKAA